MVIRLSIRQRRCQCDDHTFVWSAPTGAHDAYNAGDIVDYNGTLYKSLINGNTYSPEAYPAGWEAVEQ